jgi:integrase
MAVKKRGMVYYLRIRPFDGKLINVKTMAQSKAEATKIERAVLTALGAGDYRGLDPVSREVCVRIFRNQAWEMPADLSDNQPTGELSLWKAMELCMKYPEIKNSQNKKRHEYSFVRLIEKLGKDFPVKKIWIPEIKQYQIERLNEGAASSTINKEKSALSRMFQVLMDLRLMDVNPARFVKNLNEKAGERQVYIGFDHFCQIVEKLPIWLEPIVQTAYYTGMRRGEILGLTRKHLKLARRMILLGPDDVKEGQWKRVPIHRDLVPILEENLKVRSIGSDHLFLIEGRTPCKHSLRKPWVQAVREIGLEPPPHFHDLRHAWKTNARRSGMDPEIRESIMGHWYRGRSVNERYGRISDAELIRAIDEMSFDHGETEIQVNGHEKKKPTEAGTLNRQVCDQIVTKSMVT